MNNTNDFYCDFVLNNKIEVDKVEETDNVLAYHHTKPVWMTHIVVIPKEHVVRITDLNDLSIINEIFSVLQSIINKLKLDETNFKIVTNGGSFQDSKHLHFHLLSGEPL